MEDILPVPTSLSPPPHTNDVDGDVVFEMVGKVVDDTGEVARVSKHSASENDFFVVSVPSILSLLPSACIATGQDFVIGAVVVCLLMFLLL
jgi:hypothetical protein